MCANFYDVRTFGAVMSTGVNCGQVRGPMQITFARPPDTVVSLDISITRIAVTRPEDAVVVSTDGGEQSGKTTEMGRKTIVPYGLYRAHGFVIPAFAKQTGFSAEDLALFWDALGRMWDLDRSASRGEMACRGVYIFTHDNPLGNAPVHKLLEPLMIERRGESDLPRGFSDYEVIVDDSDLPSGVTLTWLCV